MPCARLPARVVEGGQHLRDEQGGGGALDDAGRDQALDAGGDPAGQRRHDEAHEGAEEDAVVAVAVSQPAAEDQQGRVRHAVPGDDQLQR